MFSRTYDWAYDTFHKANLGDKRRVKRLINLASMLATKLGRSIVKAFNSAAETEGAYRFIRNPDVDANDIAEAGFNSTAKLMEQHQTVLALEDTTSLEFKYPSVEQEMGHTTSHKTSRGMQAHSVLAYCPEQEQVIGLLEQYRWTRDVAQHGQSKRSTQRPYLEKESYKWERASQRMSQRLGERMQGVISICDRESDLIEYLQYKCHQQQRFVVRSMLSRNIEEADNKLYAYGDTLQPAGRREVFVAQKGGRKARTVICDVRFAPVTIRMPSNKSGESTPLNYVSCIEQGTNKGLCWHLLTSEPVNSKEQAQNIIRYYEKRWLIEEFHKAWKSGGTQVEKLRLHSKDNLERMIVVLAFIATKVHQLRYLGMVPKVSELKNCEQLLTPLEWKLLWKKREKKKLPKQVPSLRWACLGIGRLGGRNDSKRNGRVGWEALWEGWFKLQTILKGYELAMSLEE